MILGLDISTSITGYTILNFEGKILACYHIDLRKEKNFFETRVIEYQVGGSLQFDD